MNFCILLLTTWWNLVNPNNSSYKICTCPPQHRILRACKVWIFIRVSQRYPCTLLMICPVWFLLLPQLSQYCASFHDKNLTQGESSSDMITMNFNLFKSIWTSASISKCFIQIYALCCRFNRPTHPIYIIVIRAHEKEFI